MCAIHCMNGELLYFILSFFVSSTCFPSLFPPQPYDHQRVVANYHHASTEHIQQAIDAAMAARVEWERTPFEHR